MAREKLSPRQVSIDCDGTICYHQYPLMGGPLPDAIRVIKRLKKAGHILIFETMRADELLEEAVDWCKQQGVEFDYINCNPMYETGSRKIYSHISIDDHNLGTPLIYDKHERRKPYVDWLACEKLLEEKGYL